MSHLAKRANSDFKGDLPNPMMFGADGNFRQAFDGVMTAGQDVLTCASAPFVADHKDGLGNTVSEVGRLIWIDRAGPDAAAAGRASSSGGNTTWVAGMIKAIISKTKVQICNLDGSTLHASTSVSGAWVIWGVDDTASWQAFLDSNPPGRIFDGAGRTYLVSRLFISSNSIVKNAKFYLLPQSPAAGQESSANWSTGIYVLGTLYSTLVFNNNASLLAIPQSRHGKKNGIKWENLYVNGLRHFNTGMSAVVGQGSRSGFVLLGYVSDFEAHKCRAEYCSTDGWELFSAGMNRPGGVITSDADADLCFQDVSFSHCDGDYSRRMGWSGDSIVHALFERCRARWNGDLTSITSEGDLGDRDPEIYPGPFIPRGTPTSGTAGYAYSEGFDFEGYGVGSCIHDLTLKDCSAYQNAAYAVSFSDGARATDTNFIARRDITISGGFYDPGNTAPGNQIAIVFYAGFSVSATNTTLSLPVAAGALFLSLSSHVGLVAGQKIQLNEASNNEIAIVANSYSGGATVPLALPLQNSYTGSASASYYDQNKRGAYRNITIDNVSATCLSLDACTGVTINHAKVTQWEATATWLLGFGVSQFSVHGTTFNSPGPMITFLLDCDHDSSDFVQQYKGGVAPTNIKPLYEGPIWGTYARTAPAIDAAAPNVAVGTISSTAHTIDISLAPAETAGNGWPGALSIGQGVGNNESVLEIWGGGPNSGGLNGIRLGRGNLADGRDIMMFLNDKIQIDGHPIFVDSMNGVGLFYGTADPNLGVTMGGVAYQYIGIGSIYLRGWPGSEQPYLYLKTTSAQNTGWVSIPFFNSTVNPDRVVTTDASGNIITSSMYFDNTVGKLGIAGTTSPQGDIQVLGPADNNIREIRVGKTDPGSGANRLTSRIMFTNGASGEIAAVVADPDGLTNYNFSIRVNGSERLRFQAFTTQADFKSQDGNNICRLEVDNGTTYTSNDVVFGPQTDNRLRLVINGAMVANFTHEDDGHGSSGVYRADFPTLYLSALASPHPGVLIINANQGRIGAGSLPIDNPDYIDPASVTNGEYVQAHTAAGVTALRGRAPSDMATDLESSISSALLADTAGFIAGLEAILDGRYAKIGDTTSGPSAGIGHTHTI